MRDVVDLTRYPLDDPAATARLIEDARAALSDDGLAALPGFLRAEAAADAARALSPLFETEAFTHKRRHNIYFSPHVPGLSADHPALAEVETVNRTLCADQIGATGLRALYEWRPLIGFLAAAMEMSALHPMADPLAAVNVMSYRAGEALNWHFDRSEFTVTLLLQAPEAGGEFLYRPGLRAPGAPNHDGVARLLRGQDDGVRAAPAQAGDLVIFRGRDSAHKVTPVVGATTRVVAVFSYFDRPGVRFSAEEQRGFYGRAAG